MTGSSFRRSWALTGLAALGLLALTALLAARERTLPAASPPSLAATASAPDATPPAAAARPASPGEPASNGQIAFVSDRDGNPEIYLMEPDGSNQRRVTDDPAEDRSPFWSLDGRDLVWLRVSQAADEAPAWEILVAALGSGDQRTVAAGVGWPMAAVESPVADQGVVAVVQDLNGDGQPDPDDAHQLLLLDLANPAAQPTNLLAELEGATPAPLFGNGALEWSNDGSTLYLPLTVNGEAGLYALPVAGGPPALVSPGEVQLARLSPDGAHLAIWHEFEDAGRQRQRLILHDLETGQETPFVMGGMGFQFITDLQWSRDGSQLVFAGFTGASAPNVFVLDVAGDQLEAVSQRVADPAFGPALAPDGTQIVFHAQPFRAVGGSFEPAGDSNLYLVQEDDPGQNAAQVTEDQGNNYDPAWQPLLP